ncbi:hypothetical protein CIK05_06565 [Bdellovibrio sp. qaytius]|nr:hypothetical protein CIK05_06565 [Bdellovibrio sp. qaytius]
MSFMKYFLGLVVIVGVAFLSREAWNSLSQKKAAQVQSEMEKSLFPVMIAAQPKEAIFARPMWVAETGSTLTVFTEYFGDRLPEEREKVRNEMVLVVKKWAETQPQKYQFYYVTFTDEIISPDKK